MLIMLAAVEGYAVGSHTLLSYIPSVRRMFEEVIRLGLEPSSSCMIN